MKTQIMWETFFIVFSENEGPFLTKYTGKPILLLYTSHANLVKSNMQLMQVLNKIQVPLEETSSKRPFIQLSLFFKLCSLTMLPYWPLLPLINIMIMIIKYFGITLITLNGFLHSFRGNIGSNSNHIDHFDDIKIRNKI